MAQTAPDTLARQVDMTDRNQVVEPCPRCKGKVLIMPTQGGRGTYEVTMYAAECQNKPQCGRRFDLASMNGRTDSARREWNRYAKAQGSRES